MECNKCFIALSDGIKCLQLSCSILGLCYDLLLTCGEMRHLASLTWLVSSGVVLTLAACLWGLSSGLSQGVQGIRI